jgi:hypothetical protein
MNKSIRETQAFHNEFKGVLLEYTLGCLIAEDQSKIILHEKDFLNTVKLYQNHLMGSDLNTYKSLPAIAKMMKDEVKKLYRDDLTTVELAGKKHISCWGEGDLKLNFNAADSVLLSLKMIKNAAYVNTKSAGSYSFFSKYFLDEKAQKTFSKEITFSFEVFKKSLLDQYDVGTEGSFSDALQTLAISDRPGSLSGNQKDLLFDFYESCLNSMTEELKNIITYNSEQFILGLKKLCGFSESLSKLIFTYKNKDNLLVESSTYLERWEDYEIRSVKDIKILERKDSRSFITLSSRKVDIQFRIKPMNSFSTPGVKVNVSVKKKY